MKQEIIIKPRATFNLAILQEIIRFRELFFILVWRDVKLRYKQTVLGILWALIQPLVSMVIFTVFFGNLAKIPSGDLPYSLFVLIGLLFWTFFSNSLTYASDSLISNVVIIQKVYFPKIIMPFASVAKGLVDFLVNTILVFFFAAFLGYYPYPQMLFIFPWAIIITIITASGLGLMLASFNVKYRDVKYILPFFIQMLLFLNPVIYPLSIVSERNRIIMSFNPITSVVESVRQAFQTTEVFNPAFIVISTISALGIFIFGLWYFQKTERYFADII